MARLTSISLLFLFLVNLVGTISLLLIQRHKRHEFIESVIASEAYGHHLTKLHITIDRQQEINWVEEDKEFRYHGEMYDVVRTETLDDGSTMYHCIADHAETHLYSQIESNLGGTPIGHHNDQMIVIQFFKFLNVYLQKDATFNKFELYTHQKVNATYMASLSEVTLYLPSEPPEQA
jgi:hypothetical protein